MKTPFLYLIGLILFAFLPSVEAAPPNQVRTITDLNVISTRAFQRSISPKFYKSLLISPVQGWVAVRGHLVGTRLSDLNVAHSELNGRFDKLALQLAKDVQIAGYYSIENPRSGIPVLLHLLIYQIADGTMVLSFPQFTEPGGDQMEYFGCARLAVLKHDGKWVEVQGPESLQGKGWAVRRGLRNDLAFIFKMEMHRTPWDG
jgi:hypothetical protein